ncbi:MAG: sodium:solute symporter [Puniceicoccaceae bacterium]
MITELLLVFTPFIAAISPIQIGMFVAYSLGLIAISFAFKKLNKDSDDYFRAGCQGSWWLVGMSSYMMSFSAYTFTGLAGVAYEAGFSAWTQFFGNIIGFALAGLFAAAWLRQLRVTTPAEVVRDRFGNVTEQLYSWHGALFGLLYSGLTLFGVSIFTSTVFGFDIQVMILMIGVTVVVYSLVGGRWAVMGTDFAQGMILVAITFLAGFLALDYIGGIDGLIAAIKDSGLEKDFELIKAQADPEKFSGDPRKYTAPWVVASVFALTIQRLSISSAPHYFSARDGKHARGAAWFVCIMMIASTLIFFIPSMVARLEFSHIVDAVNIGKPAEASYAVICMELLPESLMGLMLIAIIAATMSAMDSGLNQQAAVVIKNIYPAVCRLMKWELLQGKKLLLLGQATTLVAGVIIILLALYFSNVEGQGSFEQLLEIGALIGVPMWPPILLALFMKKPPSYAGLVSIGAGFILSISTKSMALSYDWRVFLTFCIGAISFYLTRFLPADPKIIQARIQEFYQRMYTPVDFDKEVGSLDGVRSQAKVLSIVACVVGLLIFSLCFITEGWGWNGKMGILAITVVCLSIGALLAFYSKSLRKH